jgi:hypothetical protein
MRVLASRRLTALLVLATIPILALTYSGLVAGQEQPKATSATALLTTNRVGLKICVDSLAPGVESRVVQGEVRGTLIKISNHPDFQPAGLGRQPAVVDVGCPAPPTITQPNYEPRYPGTGGTSVTTPSQYRTFVFVASPQQLATAFPRFTGRLPRTTTQERLCEGHVCHEVTVAVYVTPEELRDPQFLGRSLTYGLGLLPVGEPRFDPAPLPPDQRGPARPSATPSR